MTAPDETGDVVATQVARLYFDRQLSKVEIGQRLGISRFRVARLLQEARASGLVRIEYRDVPKRDRDMAREMETRYGLDVCVVAAGDGDPTVSTARLAAEVVAELLEPDETVGIAWGSTLAAAVRYLPARHLPALTVVPLAGGSARLARDRAPAELARSFGERLGGGHHDLYAPAFLATTELRDALAAQPEVASALEAYGRVSTAVIGIGAWTLAGNVAGSSLIASGVIGDEELAALRSRGAVGELVVHPFDGSGRFIAPDLSDRSVAISIDRLRAVPRVVAVAGGARKASAIRGALATGIITVLVTDAAAAAAVLHNAASEP